MTDKHNVRDDKGKKDLVKSCARALDLIEYFTVARRPARTAEISAALGIPNSSADEILRTLLSKGYLTFNRQTKRYAPSYKIIGASQEIERRFFGGGRIGKMLAAIHEKTGATVCMTVQNGCWLESVAWVEGSWQSAQYPADYSRTLVAYDADGWRPATNFAGAILALHSNIEVIDVASRCQSMGLAPKNDTAMTDLIDHVQRIRNKGFALCRRQDTVEVDSIACPFMSAESNVPMAVGILGKHILNDAEKTRTLAALMRSTIAQFQEQPSYAN
jgi:DNA-binding IclR family transcriptional regulator